MSKNQVILLTSSIFLSSIMSSALTLGGVWFLLNKQHPGAGQVQTSADSTIQADQSQVTQDIFSFTSWFSDEEEAKALPQRFHPLEKVVLSVKGKRQNHLVIMRVALKTTHPEQLEGIDDYMPIVQNALFQLFSDKKHEDVIKEGVFTAIQAEVKDALIQAFSETKYITSISDVILTKFVVQ